MICNSLKLLCLHVFKCCEVRNKWREVISLPHCGIIGPLLRQRYNNWQVLSWIQWSKKGTIAGSTRDFVKMWWKTGEESANKNTRKETIKNFSTMHGTVIKFFFYTAGLWSSQFRELFWGRSFCVSFMYVSEDTETQVALFFWNFHPSLFSFNTTNKF